MPEFRFSYSGDSGTSFTHGVTAEDVAEAFVRKNDYLKRIKGEYTAGSMKVFRNTKWDPIPDSAYKLIPA